MRDMKGNLVKCGGYEVAPVITTTFNIPFLEARDRGEIPKGEPLLSIDKRPSKPENAYKWCEIGKHWHLLGASYSCGKERDAFEMLGSPNVTRSPTRSERMKEYWRNRKEKKG